MTKLILNLAAALAPATTGAAAGSMQDSPSSHRKLNLLLAAVTAALIGVALMMPGDW